MKVKIGRMLSLPDIGPGSQSEPITALVLIPPTPYPTLLPDPNSFAPAPCPHCPSPPSPLTPGSKLPCPQIPLPQPPVPHPSPSDPNSTAPAPRPSPLTLGSKFHCPSPPSLTPHPHPRIQTPLPQPLVPHPSPPDPNSLAPAPRPSPLTLGSKFHCPSPPSLTPHPRIQIPLPQPPRLSSPGLVVVVVFVKSLEVGSRGRPVSKSCPRTQWDNCERNEIYISDLFLFRCQFW